MKTEFLNRYFDPSREETFGEQQAVPLKTVKSRYYILAVDIIGYLTAYLMIRSYMGNSIKRMLWFVVLPIFFDCLGLLLFHIWFKGSQNRDESYYRSTTYIIGGVLIYSFMYCDCVLIYHDISEILIFLSHAANTVLCARDLPFFECAYRSGQDEDQDDEREP